MNIGFIGLGKMGGAMAGRLHAAGHRVVGFDANQAALTAAGERGLEVAGSITELAEALEAPRVVWIMTPPGAPTEAAVTELKAALGAGDLVIDGGNSDFRDTLRRAAELREQGITLVDVGVSGGVQGAQNGCGLLVGSDPSDFERLKPIFDALAAKGGCAHVGRSGAGHFAKAVHNGVEYAIMQAYGEGYELLAASDIDVDVLATLEAWQAGCSIRSHLLEKLIEALRPDPALESIRGYAADSGMGRWTVEEAIRLRVPTPTISAALQARFRSQQDDSPTMKSIAALRGVIGGHAVLKSEGGSK
ncbi:6-phosphogluconate dehydrogenase [Gordoniibacillus kamchatkensis]|uniref:6-phosphogluconate dehydrogenase n=1 Tax=Gordoniibacillus kamchatkensis TaxID=1590651 RepID=A0ABR5AFK3_9BACL|nr:decarboxylating 6-phosphogluconate dehydrogenase [Paenibacillus sp. VKM B-2647]KIL39838.1 6-phosphogluconate dehydrogenase [Paenibacillus sp. VKM B-2647]